METASLSEIKKELNTLTPKQLLEICIRLAKYKKENKELLHYLLFESANRQIFIDSVKAEIDDQFKNLNRSSFYLAKKTVRKVLKTTNKYIKFSGDKETEIELRIYFCIKLRKSGLRLSSSRVLLNLYQNQVKRIRSVLAMLHEDLQYDYQQILDEL
jgi:hypothetical protein